MHSNAANNVHSLKMHWPRTGKTLARGYKAMGASGNQKNRVVAVAKSPGTKLSDVEIEFVCTLCFYDIRVAMRKIVKPNILEMKSREIRPIVERLDERLADRHLDPEKRELFEAIRAKMVFVLEQRQLQMMKGKPKQDAELQAMQK